MTLVESSFYVERQSNIIYEAQFFPKYVLVRPASPDLFHHIKKLPLAEFGCEFVELDASPKEVTAHLRGGEPSMLIRETRH